MRRQGVTEKGGHLQLHTFIIINSPFSRSCRLNTKEAPVAREGRTYSSSPD